MSDKDKFEAIKALGQIEGIANTGLGGWQYDVIMGAIKKIEKIFEKDGIKTL